MPTDSRYSCQIKLPGFGVKAQAKLGHSKVLIVGAGGLGSPAAQYLASAGIGTLAIADFDTVSLSNLHRQILFSEKDVDQLKVDSVAQSLHRQNPTIIVTTIPIRITSDNVLDVISPYDIVLDCTDNFDTRYILNDGCVLADKPLVYGAAYQYEGQVAVWNAPNADGTRSVHYRDIFPSVDSKLTTDCDAGGVIPTLTGIIGCMQANETIKYVTELPGLLSGKLLVFNALTMQSHIVTLPTTSTTKITELPTSIPTISARKLHAAFSTEYYELIDVRTHEEHINFNIGGSNIPLQQLMSASYTINVQKPVVVYCETGIRSSAAAKYILDTYPSVTVVSLEGGVVAWQNEIKAA